MMRIHFDPNQINGDQKLWWNKWSKRATAAIAKVRSDFAAGTPLNFNTQIWKDLKDWLLVNVFYRKCAYCEFDYLPAAYGDAEHYRPKGQVSIDGAIVHIDGKPHPGYYWLAYHWKNIVPSCEKCNS